MEHAETKEADAETVGGKAPRREPSFVKDHPLKQEVASNGQAQSGVVVAIPTYNEEVAIASLVLAAREYADKVVVIDDGSSDRTVELAKKAGAVVFENGENRGKGFSVQKAFSYAVAAEARCLVLMDGDGQHDPAEIPQLVDPIVNRTNGDGVDVALGFRVGELTEMPAWRKVGKRVLDYATAAGTNGMVTDSQCGFRAFGADAIEAMADGLTEDGFGVESQQLMIAREEDLALENVKIHCRYEDLENTSTKGPIAHGFGVLENVIEMITQKRPLMFLGIPSMALILGAVFMGIHTFQFYNLTGYFSIPYALGTATMGIIGIFGVLVACVLNVVGNFEEKMRRVVRKEVQGQA